MSKWHIEVKISELKPGCTYERQTVWKAVRPTGGNPYQFNSKQEALQMAEMCYGSFDGEVRITNKETNQ